MTNENETCLPLPLNVMFFRFAIALARLFVPPTAANHFFVFSLKIDDTIEHTSREYPVILGRLERSEQ